MSKLIPVCGPHGRDQIRLDWCPTRLRAEPQWIKWNWNAFQPYPFLTHGIYSYTATGQRAINVSYVDNLQVNC